jgi:hypothetical protein
MFKGFHRCPISAMLWRKSMNDEVKISLQLVNGILQYLGTRPYGEVFQIVNAIHGEVQPQIPMPEMVNSDEAAKPVTDAA